MNSKNADFNKSELIKKLELLCNLEIQKPINDIDTDLIEEAVTLGLELKGLKATLTPEEVKEKVRKIPFAGDYLDTPPEGTKHRTTKIKSNKFLLIAAIISVLIAIFTVTSIAFEWNIFDELKNRFGTVADTPVNEEIDVNGISVYMHGENKKYKDIEDAILNENLNILYPSELPENVTPKEIMIYQVDFNEEVVFIFNNADFSYSVTFKGNLSNDIKNNASEIIEINEKECFITDIPEVNITQIFFVHNDNLYYLSYNNKQELIEIIENLKEF